MLVSNNPVDVVFYEKRKKFKNCSEMYDRLQENHGGESIIWFEDFYKINKIFYAWLFSKV